jgi:hypothetical protein
VIVAETGVDVSSFGSAARLVASAGVAPDSMSRLAGARQQGSGTGISG